MCRAVKPDSAALFFAQCLIDKVLGASNLPMLRYKWIWHKERAEGFLNANRAPLKKAENILGFYQESPCYHPQFTYGEPYKRTYLKSGQSPDYGKFERTAAESKNGRRYPGNVLTFSTVGHTVHPAPKSVVLCEYLIRTYTDEESFIRAGTSSPYKSSSEMASPALPSLAVFPPL